MMTFGDMMALLLALFVLMLSFSTMEAERYRQIAGTVRDAFGIEALRRLAGVIERDGNIAREYLGDSRPVPVPGMPVPLELSPDSEPMHDHTNDVVDVFDRLSSAVSGDAGSNAISVVRRHGRVVINMPAEVTFDTGSDELKPTILPVLNRMARALETTEGDILVAGHTDSVPIANARFRSNWDLATARAVSVVHYLRVAANLDPARLVAQGHADSRPAAANDTPEHRAKNRRVEISVLDITWVSPSIDPVD